VRAEALGKDIDALRHALGLVLDALDGRRDALLLGGLPGLLRVRIPVPGLDQPKDEVAEGFENINRTLGDINAWTSSAFSARLASLSTGRSASACGEQRTLSPSASREQAVQVSPNVVVAMLSVSSIAVDVNTLILPEAVERRQGTECSPSPSKGHPDEGALVAAIGSPRIERCANEDKEVAETWSVDV
jgi:hypothetical protein